MPTQHPNLASGRFQGNGIRAKGDGERRPLLSLGLAMRFLSSVMIFTAIAATLVDAAVTNDLVVGVSGGNLFTLQVVRLNGATGAPAWAYTAPLHNYPVSAVGMDPVDQSVYFAIASYGLKLNSSGAPLWGPVSFGNVPTPASFAINPFNQNTYASGNCSHGWLGQVNGSNGSLVWSVGAANSSTLNDIPSLSVGDNDGSLYGVSGNNGRLYKYSASGSQLFNKSINWSVITTDCSGGRGDFSRRNGAFYGAGGNTTGVFPTNSLYELDQNGNVLATYALPLTARVTGVAVDNASGSPNYGNVYISAGNSIYKFSSGLSLMWGPVNIGNTADFLAVDPLNGGLYVGSIGGKFVQQRFTFDGSAGWTYSTGSQPPSAMSTQRLVEPYLSFFNSAQTVSAGSCSGVATVRTQNAQNGLATTGATVNLAASDGTMLFYTGVGCGGAPVTSVTIPPGSSSASFYFKDATVGSPMITVSAIVSGYALATQTEIISAPVVPAAVADLAATAQSASSVALNWTSPGNDGNTGTLSGSYDIGHALVPISATPTPPTSVGFSDPSVIHTVIPVTTPPGVAQTATISGLSSGTMYYFALKTTNASGNISALSNVPSAQTYSISTSADGIVSLAAPIPGVTVTAVSSPSSDSIALQHGLVRITSIYDLSPSGLAFNPPARLTFSVPGGVSSSMAIYKFTGGLWSSIAVTSQAIDFTANTVSGNTATSSLYAIFIKDQLPPRTVLNIGQPKYGTAPVMISTFTLLAFASTDDFRVVGDSAGVGVAQTLYSIDSAAFAPFVSSFSISSEGLHIIRFYSTDLGGNAEAVHTSTIAVDSTPPATQAVVSAPKFFAVDGSTFVTSSSKIGFTAIDPLSAGIAAGVASTQFRIDGGAYTLFAASFTLTEGSHVVDFQSRDQLGNLELLKSLALKVDNTPPVTQLVIQGTQTVSGGVLYVSTDAIFGFSAQDPISLGIASGVKQTLYSVDGGVSGSFQSSFTLVVGTHTLAYQSIDNVGNIETLHASSFTIRVSDILPPRTTLSIGQPQYGASPLLVTSATPFGLSVVDDALAVGDGAGGGVAQRYYAIDGGAFLALVSSFTISGAGSHLVRYYSVDQVGNTETVHSSTVAVDDALPVTSLAVSTPLYAGYISPSTVFTMSAVDPVVSGFASGVAGTFVSLGTAPAAAYAGPFTLAGPEGVKAISYYSKDNLANAEVVQSTTVFLDATPPVTTVSFASSYTVLGAIYFTPTTPVTVSAADPDLAPGAPGSGVARVLASVDGGAYKTIIAPLTFADGLHSLQYQSVDNVGNIGSLRYFTLRSDGTPPLTQLVIQGTQTVSGGVLYVSTDAVFGFTAQDPAPHFVASGVKQTLYSIDGGASGSFQSPFTLAVGTHTLTYQSIDNVGNIETLHTSSFTIRVSDILPPRTTLIAGQPQYGASPLLVTSATPFGLSAVDDALTVGDGVGGGVAQRYYAIDGGAFLAFASSFTISGAGSHLIRYYSVDLAGNAEAVHLSTVAVDDAPPATSLAISTPLYAGYVSSSAVFSLSAVDPLVSGVASGIAGTFISLGTAPATAYAGPFTLSGPEGAKSISYYSKDNLSNMEVVRSTTVLLDATPPVTVVSIGASSFTASGAIYVAPTTPVLFSAADPALASGAPGSGAARVLVSVDGGPYAAVSAPLTFAEGLHSILYQSVDNVGNVELLRALTLKSDGTPPVTAFTPSGALFTVGTRNYAPASFFYTLTANDPVANSVASGLALTRYALNDAAFQTYVSTFGLVEGIRQVAFQSQDNVGNLELAKSATVYVDATAPVTALSVGTPQFSASGTLFVSTATPFSLTSQDPVIGGVNSGVRIVQYSLDGAAPANYGAVFTLQAPEGTRGISWQATDNVGNQEALKTAVVSLDATAPVTSLLIAGGRQFSGPDGVYVSADARLALVALDPGTPGAASGIALIRWQDNGGAFQVYGTSIALSEGAHAVAYQSQDNVQNLEVLRSTTVFVDATAPNSAAGVGAPSYTAPDGTLYIGTATLVSITASDPALPGGHAGSGVARIEVSVDSAAYAAYSAPLTFAAGRHLVLYRAVDQTGNVEPAHSLAVSVDATAPITTLAVSTPNAGGFVSAATLFSLVAVDPAVGGVASGVASTRYSLDGGAFTAFASSFSLVGSDGQHVIAYLSADNLGNTESVRSATFQLDQTPPVATAHVGAPSYTASDGTLYVIPATPVTFTAADAASGVDRIEVAVDGGAYAAYAFALTFAEGRHAVLYRAVDKVGNVAPARMLNLQSDATPPMTTLSPSGAFFTANSHDYAPAGFFYTLTANDPASNSVTSGLALTRYALDGGAFQTYVSTFGLVEGVRQVSFQSQDNVGNLELAKSATVYVDATAPMTALSVGAPQFAAGGTLFVSTATPFSLASQDPLVGGVASGVRSVQYRLDGGPFAAYAAAFTLQVPEGTRAVAWQAADNVGNVEAVKSAAVALDATPPLTSLLVVGGRQFPGPDASTFYASSDTRLALPAVDPAVNGAASGVAFTQYQDNGGAFQAYLSSLALAEGAHRFGYQSSDNVQNQEVPRSTNVWVDATPPVTTASIGSPAFTAADGTIYVSLATPITFAAVDPILPSGQSGSGLSRIETSLDGAPFTPYAAALTLAEGRHTIVYRAVDNVGNVEAARSISLRSDATPPLTALAVSAPNYQGFVSSSALLTFSAADPVVNGVTSGVASTRYRVNGGTFAAAPSAFRLSGPDGAYAIDYQSQDNVGNLEVVRSTSVFLDQTPPVTAVQIGVPNYVSADGTQYVTPATPVTLTAADPLVNGAASGVDRIEVAVDGGPFTAYVSPLTFAEGRHAVQYRAVDRVGNVEAARTLQLQSDNTAPVTAFQPSGAYFTAAGRNYAPLSFSYTLPAQDPVVSGVASGAASTMFHIDAGMLTRYVSAFSLTEGVRQVAFQSTDNVGNQELLKSATVYVDATPPATALTIGQPQYASPAGTLFVGPAATFALAAQDPVVQGVASGVSAVSARVDAGAYSLYGASFALTPGDGLRTVGWFAVDNVGNVETPKISTVALDATPPLTSLLVVGGRQFPGANAAVFYASSDTRLALPAVDPAVNGVASGVAFTQYQDNGGAFQVFTAPFGLPEGAHVLGCQSQDRVANLEVLRSTTVLIDAAPPVTTAHIGTPLFVAPDGTNYVTPATPVTFTAVDPALAGTATPGSGVNRIEAAIDGGAFAPYSAALTFAEGRHTILFRSIDNVGNVEAAQTLNIRSDNTSPMTALAVIGGKQAASTAANSFYASADSRFGLPAVDPIVNNAASGIAFTRYQDNGGAFQTFTVPVALTEGSHLLAYQSQDNVGNVEVLRSTTVLIDATLPVSTATMGSPLFVAADGTNYITPATPVTLSAFDPAASGLASGVDRIEANIDGAGYAAYASTLTFAEGRHTVLFRAVDRVGNVEAAHTLLLQSDNTPPVTAIQPSGALFTVAAPEGPRSYAPAQFTYSLPATDPVVSGVASGVALTRYRVGAAFQPFGSGFGLTEGIRRVDFQSQDNVGNLELLKSATIFVDAAPPVTALAIGGPKFDPGGGQAVFISAQTQLSLSAVDPLVQEVASGVNSIFFRRNADPFAAYASSFTLPLPDGFKTVAWYAVDNVSNQELAKATTVFLDNTPPQTGLAVIGGHQFPGPNAITFYASADTRLALPAVDPIAGGAASGLAVTQYQDNGGVFQAFAAPFGLAEGAHALGYRSQDKVQNMEVLRSTNVWVDAAPPASSFAFGTPYYQAPDGTNYITPATPLTFAAADPALPTGQPGAGVSRIEVAVDGAPFAVYTASLTFAEGRHAILYRSIDNVANVEATRTLNIQSDATPPVTALAVLGGHQFQGPDAASFFASADTRYSLPAVDPVAKNVASGVAFTRWQDNGGAFQPFGSALALAEGIHHLAYQSQDNVSNLEVPRSTTALVDATPPLTSLLVSGGRQFAGPDAVTFYASADTRLVLVSTDPAVNGVASGVAFTRWQDNSGAFTTSISSLALAEGAHKLGYQSSDNVANLEVLRSTNVWIDATPPATTVSVGSPTFTAADGTIYVATATPISFASADPALPSGQPGSGLSRIEVSLDGTPFTPYVSALRLAEGRHTILYRAIDNVGNVESAHSISIQSDATPPVSALVIGAPQFQLPNVLLVSSRTPFSIAVIDPVTNNVASGVKDTYYRVSDVAPSTAPFALSTAPFSLSGADVSKVVEFFSRDNVLNAEVVKSSAVLLDSTPPEVALLSPATCDSGLCRVLKGKFPVLGTARDLHFGNYVLDYAPVQTAAAGFTLISSGTAAVNSGALGTWDASAMSGWLTLRLTATDLVMNTASVAVNVFVGDPGELLTLGNHEVFDMPEGVAAGGDGKIYVADRDNDRIAVFSSTGTLLASFGVRGHDDDHLSTGTLRLDEPSGVAVDAAGNIYVADTDHDRVLKLSATGQILLSLGGREHDQEDRHDDKSEGHDRRQPGRFHHPAGVAVDASQNIFVADTDNRRVQVFSSTGGFTLQFDLPPVPVRPDRDEDDHDDDSAVAALGKPFALALDAAGNIYVADPRGGRALKFGATGQLLLTVPITGDKPGSIGRPFGVAVSASGDCLLVSDRKSSRVLKFDFLGSQNLVFGAKGKVHDDDAPAPRGAIVFNKPVGLALDGQGNLFVADRNNDRVRKFALPTGQPPLVVPAPKPEDEHVARDVVDKEDGGKIERKDRAAVEIPAGAVAQDMKVTVSTPTAGSIDASNRRHAVDAAQLKTASPPVEYGPEGTKFAAPVTLTLPYSPDLVALEGVDEADLTVRYWNRDKAQWENLDSVVDPKTHTVKAKTTHFSLYQVFSGTATAGLRPLAVGDPTFMFHDAYAFPNPVRGVNAATIRIQPGLADSVEVHVYDLAGRRVYSSSNFSLNTGLDDGNGKGVQYTYDNVWDISGVGSGVYQYVLTAKKSGQSDIHKAGRIAVVK